MALRLDRINVLVVEDLKPMRDLIVGALEAFGIGHIVTANDGESGFAQFIKHTPDIVITDWMMEPVDGLELIQRIRKSPMSINRLVPIILITGYSAMSRVTRARDLGVTEFLTKPFTADDLAKRITHIINKPRDFVEAPNFFGPDRRRRKPDDYAGPRRREAEGAPTQTAAEQRRAARPPSKNWEIDKDNE